MSCLLDDLILELSQPWHNIAGEPRVVVFPITTNSIYLDVKAARPI